MAQEQLDILWVLVCSVLVFLMQGGFLCLESGLTRSKNSINVAIKNLADFCITTVVFWGAGFAIMFGLSQSGWVGGSGFLIDFSASEPMYTTFFLYQVMFCGAAVTIMSGAVAERMRFTSYMIVAVIVSGLIYPVFGHWAWAGLETGDAFGFLNSQGFVDFAGSSVVHSVGGWVSLAAVLIIGPRHGRFGPLGESLKIAHSNLPLATLGVVLLFIGWMGFNGGSTLAMNADVPGIIVNTVISGCVGALSAGLLGFAIENRLNVGQFMNGCLGGLVAITANCFAVTTEVAALIGLIGGMIVIGVEQLLEKLQIDDAVGAVPVHLGAGIWGTLAVGLYGDLDKLGTGLSRFEQIAVQLEGILVCAVWAFGITFALLKIVDQFHPLRVSLADEKIGLNISEHGEDEGVTDADSVPAPVAPVETPLTGVESNS